MAKKKPKVVIDTSSTIIEPDELPKTMFGDFLRADDVNDGEVVVIKSPAVIMTTKFGSHRVVQVVYGGRLRTLRLNRLSLRNLVDAWGENSELWVDKKAKMVKTTILGKTAVVLEPAR